MERRLEDANDPAIATPSGALGDLPVDEWRRHAHALVDWIAAYLAAPERYPVRPSVEPGFLREALPPTMPEEGQPFDELWKTVETVVLPGTVHWNHPGFLAYFAITGSGPGILGELLAAALNVNAMLWHTGPAATELELLTTAWLRDALGLPSSWFGVLQDTASVSLVTALAAARHRVDPEVRTRGLRGAPRLRLYASTEAHSSVDKAAILLGLGQEAVRRLPTDARFCLDAEALRRAIEEDRAAGWRPFAVVATVGTTSTAAIDPVPAIADICQTEGLWLHVDAAYGGAAAIAQEFRWVLDGCAAADSFVVNPHKWLFTPMDCSVLYFADPAVAQASLALTPEYLRSPHEAPNLMDYGPALGRRFRALKLWFVLATFGRRGLAARIRAHVAWARAWAQRVALAPPWRLEAPTQLGLVVFRYAPPERSAEEQDALNLAILERVNASGEVFLSHTRVRGRVALRLAVGNLRTTPGHLDRAWMLLRAAAAEAA